MKQRIPGLIAFLVAAITTFYTVKCSALDFVPENWTKADTARQLAYMTVLAVDAGQTADIQNHDDLVEKNPVISGMFGDNPTSGQTAAYFVGAGVAHYAVSAMLKPKYRKYWQSVTLSLNTAVVANNYQLGLKWGF